MEVKGHAGYDEYGKDIVCAAVSVLTVNMANSVEKFTDDGFKGSVDEKTGQFIFHFTGTVSAESTPDGFADTWTYRYRGELWR